MKKNSIDINNFLLLPNSNFRSTNDKSCSSYIHDSQIDCAKEVIRTLLRKVTRRNSIILSAKMQSGKTGVTTAMANIITRTPIYREMGIDKFFFITGMNDTGLKDQTSQRVINQVINANVDNTYIGKRSKKNLSRNRFFILKNSDLMKFEGETLNNSIIFIDESHYGSNEKNILTKFMLKHKIDWKNTNSLIGRNIYIVSVSATPFDEIFSDKAECKKIIELVPGEGYVGVSEMLQRQMLIAAEASDVEEDGLIFDYIDDAYARMRADGVDGAIIIRTSKGTIITSNPSIQKKFDIFEMNSSSSKIDYAKFNQLMSRIVSRNTFNSNIHKSSNIVADKIQGKPLLVLIKGAYRAGITLDALFKDYIYMIFDVSLKSETTAQALLGRMCGYRSENAHFPTKIYLNKNFAEMYGKWENCMQDRNAIPANNLKYDWVNNDYAGNDVKFKTKSKGNFTISLDGDECKEIIACSKFRNEERVKRIAKIFQRLLRKHNKECTYDFIGQLYLGGKNTYAVSTQQKRFNEFASDSLICQFHPNKLHGFTQTTGRQVLTREDLGKCAIDLMLDCTIDTYHNVQCIGGNRRLLVYYYELGQQTLQANRRDMYKKHKDTSLV